MHCNETLPHNHSFMRVLHEEAGYTTGMFGKFMNAMPKSIPPGYDAWVTPFLCAPCSVHSVLCSLLLPPMPSQQLFIRTVCELCVSQMANEGGTYIAPSFQLYGAEGLVPGLVNDPKAKCWGKDATGSLYGCYTGTNDPSNYTTGNISILMCSVRALPHTITQ